LKKIDTLRRKKSIFMVKFFEKIIVLVMALLACKGCTINRVTTSTSQATPDLVETVTPECLDAFPPISVRGNESSNGLEIDGDTLEVQGEAQKSLDEYSKAYLLYLKELGYATRRSMRGDPTALKLVNSSIESPEFPFKVGRVFAQVGKHESAINCFTESLNQKTALSTIDADAYLNRGESYLAIGQKEKARQDYQKAVELFQQYNMPQYEKKAAEKLRSVTPR
jgi:tetratricopeptide (TPR) repeat protein